MRKELDLGCKNSFFWSQITSNHRNKINTWAIFGIVLFLQIRLCLTPLKSLTQNIGLDNSGVNCSQDIFPNQELNNFKIQIFQMKFTKKKII